MSYQIEITPAARREIRALPAYVHSETDKAIHLLGDTLVLAAPENGATSAYCNNWITAS